MGGLDRTARSPGFARAERGPHDRKSERHLIRRRSDLRSCGPLSAPAGRGRPYSSMVPSVPFVPFVPFVASFPKSVSSNSLTTSFPPQTASRSCNPSGYGDR